MITKVETIVSNFSQLTVSRCVVVFYPGVYNIKCENKKLGKKGNIEMQEGLIRNAS